MISIFSKLAFFFNIIQSSSNEFRQSIDEQSTYANNSLINVSCVRIAYGILFTSSDVIFCFCIGDVLSDSLPSP